MQPSSSLWAGAYRRQTWASVNGWWCVDLPPAQLLHCCQDSAFHERVLRWSMDSPAILTARSKRWLSLKPYGTGTAMTQIWRGVSDVA